MELAPLPVNVTSIEPNGRYATAEATAQHYWKVTLTQCIPSFCMLAPPPPHPLIPARSYFEINSPLVSSLVRLSVSRNELELCLSLSSARR